MKNVAIGLLIASTAILGFLTYQSTQKTVALEVLLADKSNRITALEEERGTLSERLASLQAEVDQFTKAEAERLAAEEALNAANVSETDMQEFGETCRKWIAKEFGDDDLPSVTDMLTVVSDAWMKDGFLVFEVATPSRTGSTSSMFLCVVDKEKGSMFKPSAFETANWRRAR